MTDFASLSLAIDSTSAVEAKQRLDELTKAGQKTEEQTDAMAIAHARNWLEQQKATAAYYNQGQGAAAASKEVQRLLDRYDPLGSKLRSLQSDFALLNTAVMGGGAGQSDQSIDKTYKSLNDEISKTKLLMVAAGAASAESLGVSAQHALNLGLNTQYARRELMTLGREALSGDFARLPLTFGSLVAHSNLLAGLLTPVGLALAGATGGFLLFAAAAFSGARETKEMNAALDLTSGYAGLTRGDMLELARAVDDAGIATVGQAKAIITELVRSGQVGSQAVGAVAMLAADFAKATGKDVDKIAPELVKLFGDPAKGAEELNKQMHFLSPAEIEHIAHLQRIGDLGAAQAALADRMALQVPKAAADLGVLEKAWNGVRGAASSAWDAMLNVGRDATLEDKIAGAQSVVEAAQKRYNFRSSDSNLDALSQAQARLQALQAQLDAARKQADAKKGAAADNQLQNDAANLVKSTSQYQKIAEVTDKIALANKFNATTDEERRNKAQTIYELEVQRLSLARAATQEGRALTQEGITAAVQLYEVNAKSTGQAVEALYKLGKITQDERDRQMLANDLALLSEKRLANEKMQNIGNLTKLEKAKLEAERAIIDAQANARRAEYEAATEIEKARRRSLQDSADASSQQGSASGQLGSIERLQAEVEALRLKRAEMGKTREEVEMLRVAESQRQVEALEFDASTSQLGEDDPYVQRIRKQIALIRERTQLEADTGADAGVQAAYDQRIKLIESLHDREKLTDAEYKEEMRQAEAKHQNDLSGLTQLGLTQRQRFAQMSAGQQAATLIGMLESMTSASSTKNKAMFEINKIAATANAVVKGWEAVQSAYAFGNTWGGPYAGAAMAAIAAVATAANVAAIQSTTFGSGVAPGVGATAAPPVQPIQQVQAQPQTQSTVIEFHGTTDERKLLRAFVDMLNENSADGGNIRIAN